MKERSPFSPGMPVPVEYFVGRKEEIDRLIKGVKQTSMLNENLLEKIKSSLGYKNR